MRGGLVTYSAGSEFENGFPGDTGSHAGGDVGRDSIPLAGTFAICNVLFKNRESRSKLWFANTGNFYLQTTGGKTRKLVTPSCLAVSTTATSVYLVLERGPWFWFWFWWISELVTYCSDWETIRDGFLERV